MRLLTDTELLALLPDITEIDDRGRVVVPFLLREYLDTHAAAENRQRRAQAETRKIVKRERSGVAHV